MLDRIYKITILTIAFILGIFTTQLFICPLLIILTIIFITLSLCFLLKNKTLTSLALIANFMCLGHLSIVFEKRKNTDNFERITCVAYLVRVVDEEKNIAKIIKIKNEAWSEMAEQRKVKLKTEMKLKYGDLVLIQGAPQNLKNNKNPFCFDYKNFLQEQNIGYHHKLSSYKIIDNEPENYFLGVLRNVREKIKNVLQRYIQDEQARGVILAMVLGLKGSLEGIQDVYSTTGVVHVLAVSGLHVGIIFLIINSILGFLFQRQPQHIARLILTLLTLWFYAGLTGFSPSVLRSTLMCSIMLLCNFFSTKTKIQSSIVISALLLLLFDSTMLFNVGFQLSYCAVIGIVLFQKKIYKLFTLENKFLKYLWELTSVTLSAQIFTLPLILFYFQKFPTYFVISNLIIIPMSSVFVILGILVISSSPINFLYKFLSYLLNFVLVTTNKIMVWISELPKSSIQGITIDMCDVILLYGVIMCVLLFCQKEKFLKLFCMICFSFMSKEIFMGYKSMRQRILIFYNLKPYWAMSFIKGSDAVVFSDQRLKDFPMMIESQIVPSLEHYGVGRREFRFYDEKIKMLEVEQKKICVVNDKIFFPPLNFEFDYLWNNSFSDVSDKVRAKENIFTWHCEGQKTLPQVFILSP